MSASQILVVEDEAIVARGIKNELEQFGYAVPAIASSAAEAVAKAVKEKPDLVLMDIHLKGEGDGIEAARAIHERCRIPVVYLSAFADPKTVARAGATEAFGYLLKPYDERELQTTIEMALAKHRAEQRLEETERLLGAILEGINDAVIASDRDNQVRFMNVAGEALTGWRKEDAVGKPVAAVCKLVQDGERLLLNDLVDRAVCDSRTVALPATALLVSRNNRVTPIEGCLGPIHDCRGEFLGEVLSLRDITARLELARMRRQSEEQTQQAQKMEAVRRLVGGIAHHLNNLLTVMLGNTSLALMRPFYEDAIYEALGRVEAAGHRAVEMVQRLLIFSGRGRGQFREIDMNAFLRECMDETMPLLDSRINLVSGPDSDLWPVNVDVVQLGQALLTLCLNAQDAMPDGGQLVLERKNVVLTEEGVANHAGGRAGEFVCVRVGDTGQGMTPEVRARLFEPFFTTKEPGQGVGLGLAFVLAVVEQHHGWIECSSEVGQGTRFDVYLPRHGIEHARDLAPVNLRKPRGARPTILLADADSMVRGFGRMILEEEGYQVLVAEDGVQAVEVFRQAPVQIDLAIIDLNIPRLPGDAVLERLLELDPNAEVLFSSAYFAEDRPQTPGENHLLGVISKPYLREELVRMVQHALARRFSLDH
jgi:PAS domain S-box-containing protein